MTDFDDEGRPVTRFAQRLRNVSVFRGGRLKTEADERLRSVSLLDRHTGLLKGDQR